MRRGEAARAPESEEFWKMKGGRIRHPGKSRVERRWRIREVGARTRRVGIRTE